MFNLHMLQAHDRIQRSPFSPLAHRQEKQKHASVLFKQQMEHSLDTVGWEIPGPAVVLQLLEPPSAEPSLESGAGRVCFARWLLVLAFPYYCNIIGLIMLSKYFIKIVLQWVNRYLNRIVFSRKYDFRENVLSRKRSFGELYFKGIALPRKRSFEKLYFRGNVLSGKRSSVNCRYFRGNCTFAEMLFR